VADDFILETLFMIYVSVCLIFWTFLHVLFSYRYVYCY